ncbi:hypothetical protein Agabi119p4_9680 [Agaricus bisporus var. burnettii]|uniref:Uncharacterized protein n=1 Tax=Agaricus bisporus var. burnettii TaxID=192524 RepID=A0A8H7C432_AGABI|nr:hypothetical protein Agabi119p4_9680 [Agaricus bisporus var. burnettii]
MDEVWGPGEQRSALAFVHIPPHVMQPVQKTITPEKNPGLNADVLGTGSSQSTSSTSPPAQDTPFWDSANKNIKNTVAFISGHDHGILKQDHRQLNDSGWRVWWVPERLAQDTLRGCCRANIATIKRPNTPTSYKT